MRIGILADIHENTTALGNALDRLASEGAERLVVLGDVLSFGKNARETTAMLARAGAGGVWGNHDIGMCLSPSERLRERYGPEVMAYMGALQPRLEVEDCLFTHVDPWLDPTDPMQIWHFEAFPDAPGAAARSFAAVPHRLMFVGHYHRWRVITPDGPLSWAGEGPVTLAEGRYLVVVHAVMQGYCALLDTHTSVLTPLEVGGGVEDG
jgi:hypothetical protein